jgi:hypothetical protein
MTVPKPMVRQVILLFGMSKMLQDERVNTVSRHEELEENL